MYVKIEKDISKDFVLIEAKKVETTTAKPMMEFSEYISGIAAPLQSFGEHFNVSAKGAVAINDIFGLVDIPTVVPITENRNRKDEIDFNAEIKGVIADGVHYVTIGNIYILNDNGQTIQKI